MAGTITVTFSLQDLFYDWQDMGLFTAFTRIKARDVDIKDTVTKQYEILSRLFQRGEVVGCKPILNLADPSDPINYEGRMEVTLEC